MLAKKIFIRFITLSFIVCGMVLTGCQSNDYDTRLNDPATTVSPAHGDVLVPDTSLTNADTSFQNGTIIQSADSMAASQPKAVY